MERHETPVLIPVSQEEFWKKIRELIKTELVAVNKNSPTVYSVPGLIEKPLYKASEVCDMFQITRQTLHEWGKEGIVKPYKIKSRVFYLWSDLKQLLAPGV